MSSKHKIIFAVTISLSALIATYVIEAGGPKTAACECGPNYNPCARIGKVCRDCRCVSP